MVLVRRSLNAGRFPHLMQNAWGCSFQHPEYSIMSIHAKQQWNVLEQCSRTVLSVLVKRLVQSEHKIVANVNHVQSAFQFNPFYTRLDMSSRYFSH